MSQSNPVSPLQAFSNAMADAVAQSAPSLVTVRSHRSTASGFAWRPGLIVTSDEALADEGEISVVLPNGETSPATLAGRDPTTDVALLRFAPANLKPVPFSPTLPKVGEIALVAGARDGAPTANLGIVAHAGPAWRSMRGGEITARIELGVSLRRQAEGGLALDASGHAMGMTVFGPRRRVLVIPAATIERVAARLESHGRISRGYLGLGLQPVRLAGGGVGAMVMSVDASGPGATSGLHQGDVIVAWNAEPIRGVQSMLRALGPDSVGSAVRLSVRRAGAEIETSLTVGERPES
jgi:S1-C subfamily serine protease